MKVKKLFSIKNLITIAIAIALLLFCATIVNAVKTEQVESKPRTIAVKVTADKKIKKILMYKKDSKGQYILFYKAQPGETAEYVVTIPENQLSTESQTEFKIVVIEEDGTRSVGDIVADKLEPYPSINPSETAEPSWKPSPIPTQPTWSATPTPSQSSAPTESPSPSGSSEPTNSPSSSPSAEPTPTPSQEPVSGNLEVHYINPNSRVDAIYIKVGDKGIYIDGGFHSDAKAEIAYMDRIGVTNIDYYICSHAHSNHVGAGGPIVLKYGIKHIICSKATYSGMPSAKWMMLNKGSDAEDKAVKAAKWTIWGPGDSMEVNGLKINCYGPMKITNTSPGKTPENYNSLILRMDYGNTSFLFAGDTGASQLSDSNKSYPNKIDVDVYKNSHHNGQMKTSVLNVITPKFVVFTTKDGYLPTNSYLKILHDMGAKTYIATNSKDKNVLITSDGTNIKVKTKN